MSRRGRKIFRELAGITEAMDVLTVSDHHSLAMLSDAYGDYFGACEAINEHGATYKVINRDRTELVKANPAVAMKSDAWRRIQSGLSKFGLDPSSRAGLVVNHPKSDNPFDIEPPIPRSQMRIIPGTRILVPADHPALAPQPKKKNKFDDDEFDDIEPPKARKGKLIPGTRIIAPDD